MLVSNIVFSGYSITKISNDECLTSVSEGSARIFATGNSGPYTVKGPNNITKTINLGQNSVDFTNLADGTHTFSVENSYGCETSLIITILKVNCGECPVTADRTYTDYPLSGTGNLTTTSSSNLSLLSQYFTSGFTINSDLLESKICVKDVCNDRNLITLGSIKYSDIIELENRLKDSRDKIKIKLYDNLNNEILPNQTGGVISFENLPSGTYRLKLTLQDYGLTTGPISSSSRSNSRVTSTILLSERSIRVFDKVCDNSSKTSIAKTTNNNEQIDSDEGQLNYLLNQENSLELSSFPNPFNDKLNLTIESSIEGHGTLQVLNSVGSLVFSKDLSSISAGVQNMEIDLSNLAPGAYKLMLKMENHPVKVNRIVKAQ